MTREQAKSELMQIYGMLSEEKKQALDVLMAQADGNLISRQAAMDCFKKWQPYMATRLHEFEKELSELPIVAIPSAEPKTGHWIVKITFPTKLYDEYLKEYECSECYRRIRCTESQLVNYPYCHCGAKMADEQESDW